MKEEKEEVSFRDKSILITGAGRGLGKDYALFFGSRGGKVIVNDIDIEPALEVVELIKSNGGVAVANSDSAVDGEKLVNCAIDNFGKIDILINNAGVALVKPFLEFTSDDLSIQMKVNVETAFACSKAVWPHFVKQKHGKIVNLTSPFGLYGFALTIPYSMAKAALIGLTKSLAIEGRAHNIQVNAIAPMALTRMTENNLPYGIDLKIYGPEKVTPLLAYLCIDDCKETGSVFEASCGWISKVRVQRAKGTFFESDFDLEDVISRSQEMSDFERGTSDENESSLNIVRKCLDEAKKNGS